MNLQVKFSLIFLLVFGVQLAVAGYVCDGFLSGVDRGRDIAGLEFGTAFR